MTDTPLKDRLRAPAYWMSGSSDGHEGENDAPREAADRIEALEREVEELKHDLERVMKRENRYLNEVERLRGLISEKSIEAIAEDIAIACVDCRQEIRDARNRAMLRLGERLRKPLPIDLKRASLSNIEEGATK